MIDRQTFGPQTAAYYTLGCKLNFAETSTIGRMLEERGIRRARNGEPVDICIINTCSVTAVSDKKSRQMIRRAKKNSPDAVVAACGCYVQTHEEEAKSLGIDLLMGTNDRARFLDRLEEAVKTRETVADIDDAFRFEKFDFVLPGTLGDQEVFIDFKHWKKHSDRTGWDSEKLVDWVFAKMGEIDAKKAIVANVLPPDQGDYRDTHRSKDGRRLLVVPALVKGDCSFDETAIQAIRRFTDGIAD